jgi:hypothetical protein
MTNSSHQIVSTVIIVFFALVLIRSIGWAGVGIAKIYYRSNLGIGSAWYSYTSSLLTSIPPLPGVKAKIDIRYTPNAGFTYAAGNGPAVLWFAEPWLSSNITTAPPFETQINVQVGTVYQPPQRLNLSISPENQFISDAVLGGGTVFTSTGVRLRHQVFRQENGQAGGVLGPQQLIINVLGFDVTR